MRTITLKQLQTKLRKDLGMDERDSSDFAEFPDWIQAYWRSPLLRKWTPWAGYPEIWEKLTEILLTWGPETIFLAHRSESSDTFIIEIDRMVQDFKKMAQSDSPDSPELLRKTLDEETNMDRVYKAIHELEDAQTKHIRHLEKLINKYL